MAVSSRGRPKERTEADSGQDGHCEGRAGYGSQASKSTLGAGPVVMPTLYLCRKRCKRREWSALSEGLATVLRPANYGSCWNGLLETWSRVRGPSLDVLARDLRKVLVH